MNLKLTFVNVGYGEAMLLQCPGFTALIDAGSGEDAEYRDAASGRVRVADYLEDIGLNHIDLMIATHVHEDHICGLLPVAQAVSVTRFWHTLPNDFYQRAMRPLPIEWAQNNSQRKFLAALNDYQALMALLKKNGTTIESVAAGHEEAPCPGLRLRVLAPDAAKLAALEARLESACAMTDRGEMLAALSRIDASLNNHSIILALQFGRTRLLLPGDTNRAGFSGIAPDDLRADLFKVGHHGQIDGASAALLAAVAPKWVVCCASSDRRYDSAHPELLSMIRESGAQLRFSDCPPFDGAIPPPHRALSFDIDGAGHIRSEYIP